MKPLMQTSSHAPRVHLARAASVTVLILASAGMSGCGLFQDNRPAWAKQGIQPVAMPASAPGALADDGLYADAVSAIGGRDYASALDALQGARARDQNDPRVWNAFGVVYDKLGRFDLSARYYAKAAALDPGSPIVANNRAYSRLIQGHGAPAEAAATVLADADPVVTVRPSFLNASRLAPTVLPRMKARLAVGPIGPVRPTLVSKVAALLGRGAAHMSPGKPAHARPAPVRLAANGSEARTHLASAGDARIDLVERPALVRSPRPVLASSPPRRPTVVASANLLAGKVGRP